MIKKILLMLIICMVPLYSVPVPDVSREIALQGAYRDVKSISVEVIPAQTQSYRFGMPFDIQDRGVEYTATDSPGRPIAHWSFLSNSTKPFRISVSAEPLRWVEDPEIVALDYILTFTYRAGYYVAGSNSDESLYLDRNFRFDTSNTSDQSHTPSFPENALMTRLRGSVDGTISFKFTEDGWKKANSEDAPPGNYSANVSLKLEVIE